MGDCRRKAGKKLLSNWIRVTFSLLARKLSGTTTVGERIWLLLCHSQHVWFLSILRQFWSYLKGGRISVHELSHVYDKTSRTFSWHEVLWHQEVIDIAVLKRAHEFKSQTLSFLKHWLRQTERAYKYREQLLSEVQWRAQHERCIILENLRWRYKQLWNFWT